VRGLCQQIQIERIVPVFEKRPLASIATLGDVVRYSWEDVSG
jgi:hypothetical protein